MTDNMNIDVYIGKKAASMPPLSLSWSLHVPFIANSDSISCFHIWYMVMMLFGCQRSFLDDWSTINVVLTITVFRAIDFKQNHKNLGEEPWTRSTMGCRRNGLFWKEHVHNSISSKANEAVYEKVCSIFYRVTLIDLCFWITFRVTFSILLWEDIDNTGRWGFVKEDFNRNHQICKKNLICSVLGGGRSESVFRQNSRSTITLAYHMVLGSVLLFIVYRSLLVKFMLHIFVCWQVINKVVQRVNTDREQIECCTWTFRICNYYWHWTDHSNQCCGGGVRSRSLEKFLVRKNYP